MNPGFIFNILYTEYKYYIAYMYTNIPYNTVKARIEKHY